MRRFVEGWRRLGLEHRWAAHIVNYADDFVICCKRAAPEAMVAMRQVMEKLKTDGQRGQDPSMRAAAERFDFLGYTFGKCYSAKDGHAYIGTRPSKKSVERMVSSISEVTDRSMLLLDAEEMVGRLNRKLTGWANYFCLVRSVRRISCSTPTSANGCAGGCARSIKLRGNGKKRYPDQYLREELGLVHLSPRTHNLPWAKA